MNELQCRNCSYFCQHYGIDKQKIYQLYCGHCMRSRVQRKTPNTKACESFVQLQTEETPFVTKKYLSKELLRYIMALDLLPEIKEIIEEQKGDA